MCCVLYQVDERRNERKTIANDKIHFLQTSYLNVDLFWVEGYENSKCHTECPKSICWHKPITNRVSIRRLSGSTLMESNTRYQVMLLTTES